MTESRPEVEGWDDGPEPKPEWEFHRPGMDGGCRCVWSDQSVIRARHPECPVHPSIDEIGFWSATTIAVVDGPL